MGRYWAIGCVAEIYRAFAIVGIVMSIVLAPFTFGLSLIGIPSIFAMIVFAQFLRLMLDVAHSSRGTYEILKRQYSRSVETASPHGTWGEPPAPKQKRPATNDDDDFFAPRTRR